MSKKILFFSDEAFQSPENCIICEASGMLRVFSEVQRSKYLKISSQVPGVAQKISFSPTKLSFEKITFYLYRYSLVLEILSKFII